MRQKIVDAFSKYDDAPLSNQYGDPMQGPLFLQLEAIYDEHGSAIIKPLLDVMYSTVYRYSAGVATEFLGIVEGSQDGLYKIALDHPYESCRTAAIYSLDSLGEAAILRRLYHEVGEPYRSYIARIVIMRDINRPGWDNKWLRAARDLSVALFNGRSHVAAWKRAREALGEERARSIARQVRDHPYLPDSAKDRVRVACGELA